MQGFAVKAGMLMARGQQLLMMDADGATRVSDLGKLQEQLSKLARIPGGPITSFTDRSMHRLV